MSIEHNAEATAFESRPWGGQQRLIPLAHRFARPADAPAPEPVVVEPVRPRRDVRRERISSEAPRVAAGSIEPVPMVVLPVAPVAPVAWVAPVAPPAVAAFSVKHGRAYGPFIVPHLPKVAQVYSETDRTVAVRRTPLGTRAVVAAPVGAVLGVVAILIIYLAGPGPSPRQVTGAASLAVDSQPQIVKMSVERTEAAPAPAPAAAPALAIADEAPVADEAADEIADEIAETVIEIEPVAKTKRSSRKATRRAQRPRRIVAVDTSTPLGNLRPGRM